MEVIDVWGQITTERMVNSRWMETLNRWTGKRTDQSIPTVKDTLKAMDKAHVTKMMLSAWHGPNGALVSNQEVNDQISQAPDRFHGLASVDISRPMEAVRELRRWVDGEKFVGVRIVPWLWDLPPNDRRYYPIYAECANLDVPVCTQVGHTGPLMRSETGRPIPYLEDVLLEFPELTIVGGHVGFPWVNELASLLVKFRNFYLDTSAYALHRLPPDFIHLMKSVGSGRVMFGTNWPMLSPARCLHGLEDLGLTTEHKGEFLGGVARQVFRI